MATKENIIIEYTVDTTQLESAIDLMLRLGQVDKKTADDFKAATKSYNERTNAINQQTAAIEGEEKALQELNQVAKKSMEGILNASQAELVEGALLGIQDALDEVGMSAKELSGAPAKSLRDVTKEIKALQAQAAQLEAKGDLLGADKAIRKAGELQDKIGDLRAATKAYASDTRKLDAVVQGITAVSSAYQVAAGAQALLGGNSKEWEKTLIKLNAVMAVTNGLQQIQSLLQKETALSTTILIPLQKAWTFAIQSTAGAFNTLKGAIVTTGIGALVVGAGLLIQKLMQWQDENKNTTETQDELNKSIEKGTDAVNENRKAIEQSLGKSAAQTQQETVKTIEDANSLLKTLEAERKAILTNRGSDILLNKETGFYEARKGLREKELKNIQTFVDGLNAGLIQEKNIRLRIEEIRKPKEEKKTKTDVEKVNAKRVADAEQIEQKLFDTTNDGLDKRTQAELDRLSIIIDENYKTQEEIANNEKYWAEKKVADEKKRIQEIKDFTVSQFETISQAIFQINQNRRDEELGNALSALEEEKNKLLANKRLTDKKRAAIEEEYRKKEAQIKTDAFKKDQQARVTEAIIAGALAVVKALPNYVLAAAAAVTTAAQVAVIKSQPVPKFAKGVERLTGAGTETSDSIHAMLSRGERVVPARINDKYFPALTAIHNGKVTPEYANAMLSTPEYIGLDNKSALLLSASRNTLDYKELSRHLAHELKESNEGVIDTLRDGIYVKNLKELKSSNNYDIRRR